MSAPLLAKPAPKIAQYAVRPGDTLSDVAARFGVRGGWQALYAANRPAVGPDPNVVRAGTALIIPGVGGPAATARYRVTSGDTLSDIAARLGVRGGWQALYAANRAAVGPNPNVIRAGTVLGIPGRAAARTPVPPAAHRRHRQHQSPPPAGGVRTLSGGVRTSAMATVRTPAAGKPMAGNLTAAKPAGQPAAAKPAAGKPSAGNPAAGKATAAGLPAWLTVLLLAVGVVIGGAFLLRLIAAMAASRERRKASGRATEAAAVPAVREPARVSSQPNGACIVQADHDRLIVTHSAVDNTVYVLRPPGEDPRAILRVARLVLAEARYRELAEYLGLPASWPIVLADYHRLVVTHSAVDNTVYVLRPPGEDPMAVLRAARLVLQEEPYDELANHLGVSASWPLE